MADDVARVAIAVVEHSGYYLVGTRKPGEVLAGHAEFPGGKCLPGEEAATCAIRECREETGLTVVAVRRLSACRHTYAHGSLDLEFWHCLPEQTIVDLTQPVENGFRWVPAQALKSLHFPAANEPVIRLLTADSHPVG
jgi:8-oxo-dGTP diphosphatase